MTTPSLSAPYRIDVVASGTATVPCPNLMVTRKQDVQVWANDQLQLLGLNYDVLTATLGQQSGCVVQFLTSLGANTKVTVLRNEPNSQSVDYVEGGPLPAESHEEALDLLTRFGQMLQELINRALKYSVHTIITAGATTLPTPVANWLLGWNNAGTALENKDPTTIFPNSALLSNSVPQPIGAVGLPGSSIEVSRSDHVHASATEFIVDPALGNGVADATSGIQTTLNAAAAAGGGTVFIPNGVYMVSAQLVIPNEVVVVGETTYGTIIYQTISATAVNGVFRTDGSTSLSQTINGAIGKGARTITLTDATGYAVGDLIEIRNVEAAVQAADGSNNAHTLVTLIMDKSGNILTLLDPLPFTVGASDTEAVVKVTPKRVEIHNLTINGLNNTGQAPYGNNAIVLFHTRNVVLRNLNLVNYQKGNGIFLWSSFGSKVKDCFSENAGDTVGFGSAFATFDCTHCDFENLTALWPSRDGMTFNRNTLCKYSDLTSVRAQVRNVKFHGCLQCVASNIIGNNSQGGTGLTLSGGTSDCTLSNITTTGNKGPNASGNQVGVWFADLSDQNNVLSGVNSWDNGDWDITVFATDTGNVINGARFSTASKVLNQNRTPMFDVMLDDVLSGGLTSVGMVETTVDASAGPSHRLLRHSGFTGLLGEYVFAGVNSNNALVEYAKVFGSKDSATPGAETGHISIQNIINGANFTQMEIAHGIVLGNASGGAKGWGTLNAIAVFDDNVLVSDYVFDPQAPSPERFDPSFRNPQEYAKFWQTHGHLPSMPSRQEWEIERKSLGELVQRLWETVELQAIHIEELRKKVEE